MFFAITALCVSVIQLAIGVAIGLALRRQRQRRLASDDEDLLSDMQPVDWSTMETDEPGQGDSAPFMDREADQLPLVTSRAKSAELAASTCVVSVDEPAAAVRSAMRSGHGAKAEVKPVEKAARKNRRQSPRRPFQYRQQVAPYHGGSLPGKASFREVECQDISSTGFSFLSSQLPDFDSIVVALGAAPQQIYLWAHIVSRFPLDDGPAPLYRIGCRFVGPVSR